MALANVCAYLQSKQTQRKLQNGHREKKKTQSRQKCTRGDTVCKLKKVHLVSIISLDEQQTVVMVQIQPLRSGTIYLFQYLS